MTTQAEIFLKLFLIEYAAGLSITEETLDNTTKMAYIVHQRMIGM